MMDALAGAAERLVATAVTAVATRAESFEDALEQLDAPIYVTDAAGVITFFNAACIDFAGRAPTPGQDRWCVTWKLFELDGAPLPHDQCPMAAAIRDRRPNRGLMAVAARPDGTEVLFTPFPTPILDEAGELLGAVNLLLAVDVPSEARRLRDRALHLHRLRASILDRQAASTLRTMAAEYEAKAARLESFLDRQAA